MTWNQLRPSYRHTHPVDITILDESGQPMADATLAFQEFEVIPFIPLLPFGPFRTILNDRTVITNKEGKAHIDARYYSTIATAVSRAGVTLNVAYNETTDSATRTSKRSFAGQLPQWDIGTGFPNRSWQSTIVVRP
jgi:hypothetical protein